jgi:spore germination cell wall hydrolase CwlJ-like protein
MIARPAAIRLRLVLSAASAALLVLQTGEAEAHVLPRKAKSSDSGSITVRDAAVAPFVLRANDQTLARATHCLTEAVYYEAGFEPREGQQAVAQVVLNRLRRKSFPKSVCGVVFEGSTRRTGCQFTFTCDGSLARRPEPSHWEAAREVATAALAGYVAPAVGQSTHYHAVWMTPYWSASLVRTRRIGGHVFYRKPGVGETPSLNAPRGDEGPATPSDSAPARTAAGISQFSVWGLPMATVTNRRGAIVVHEGS